VAAAYFNVLNKNLPRAMTVYFKISRNVWARSVSTAQIQVLKFKKNIYRQRKQVSNFERKVYRRILGPVYNNVKENWRILTNKEISAIVKQPTITETLRLIDYVGLDMYRKWKEIDSQKSNVYEFGNNKTKRQTKKQMTR
jgi:hypothetical protein